MMVLNPIRYESRPVARRPAYTVGVFGGSAVVVGGVDGGSVGGAGVGAGGGASVRGAGLGVGRAVFFRFTFSLLVSSLSSLS